MDWNSFWVNIWAGSTYFTLGILFSIWLIPKFTIRLLKKRNIIHFRTKITLILSELCDFLNHMPDEFKLNEDSAIFLVKNKKFPDLFDFVALLKPNVLKSTAPKQLKVNILQAITNSAGENRHDLIRNELERLKPLQHSLENILSTHSLNIDDNLISNISSLCIAVRAMENEFRFNAFHEELTGEKEGISGAGQLDKIYDKIVDLLRLLEKEDGIKRQ